jgi:hypothetical protein
MRGENDKWHLREHPWDCVLSGSDGVPYFDCKHLNKKNNPPSCGNFHRAIHVDLLLKPIVTKRWNCDSLIIVTDDVCQKEKDLT